MMGMRMMRKLRKNEWNWERTVLRWKCDGREGICQERSVWGDGMVLGKMGWRDEWECGFYVSFSILTQKVLVLICVEHFTRTQHFSSCWKRFQFPLSFPLISLHYPSKLLYIIHPRLYWAIHPSPISTFIFRFYSPTFAKSPSHPNHLIPQHSPFPHPHSSPI